MENTRISFDVQNEHGYPAEALTFIAKRSVEEFITLNSAPFTITDEEYAELQRRSERLRLYPETGWTNDKVFEHLRELV